MHFTKSRDTKLSKRNNSRYFYSIGNFNCYGQPQPDVIVKLYKKNKNLDDREELNSTTTNSTGNFDIFGHWKNSKRFTNYMSFTHKCNVSDKERCNRTLWLPFSLDYVKNTSKESLENPYKLKINVSSEKHTNYGEEKCVNKSREQSKSG